MSSFKKIAAVSSLVIYFMTIGLGYSAHFQSDPQKTYGNDWYQIDDLKDHFNHTVPVKFNLAVQVKPSPQPFPSDEAQLWAFLRTDSIYFDRLFSRLSTDLLDLLIQQKKVNLLFSFHFFM